MAEEIRSGDAVFSFDEDMTVLSWNRAAEALTGQLGRRDRRAAVLGGAGRARRARRCLLLTRTARSPATRLRVAGRAAPAVDQNAEISPRRHCLDDRARKRTQPAALPPPAAQRPGGVPGGARERCARPALTPRQLEVLQLIARRPARERDREPARDRRDDGAQPHPHDPRRARLPLAGRGPRRGQAPASRRVEGRPLRQAGPLRMRPPREPASGPGRVRTSRSSTASITASSWVAHTTAAPDSRASRASSSPTARAFT